MESLFVTMIRADLKDIPQHPLPADYNIRLFRPGGKRTWIRIHGLAETHLKVTGRTFDANFGRDPRVLGKRMFFLVAPDGSDAGTITAWYDRCYRRRAWGLIHWVAITPEHRGRGLSKAMLTVAMNRLRALGHRRAMLRTRTSRIPAIRTYLGFGFVPDWATEHAQRAWALVRKVIHHPALKP